MSLEGHHVHGNANVERARTRRRAKKKQKHRSQQGVAAESIKRETFNRVQTLKGREKQSVRAFASVQAVTRTFVVAKNAKIHFLHPKLRKQK